MKNHIAEHKTNHAEDTHHHLLEDAQALLVATAHVAEEKVADARKRLVATVEKARETWEVVQEKAVAGVKAGDKTIRQHPYSSLGVALGIGALFGYLISRRSGKQRGQS
jgi:ElaB/YqjD/DUF883 family membrane-anchored ribosome-binding protein